MNPFILRASSRVSILLRATSIKALIKPKENYQWYTYKGPDKVMKSKTGITHTLTKGQKFGFRQSHDKKSVRMIFEDLGPTKVFTLSPGPDTADLIDKSKISMP